MSESNLDNRYMEFVLGDQAFAMPLMSVKEVIQKPEITSVPNMPSHFQGMINLRGQILGVFDIRKKLSSTIKKHRTVTPEVVIVIEHKSVSVGMIVDEVTKVLHTDSDMLKAAPLRQDDQASKYITSVIQANNEMVLVVDVASLLEIEKYQQLKAAS